MVRELPRTQRVVGSNPIISTHAPVAELEDAPGLGPGPSGWEFDSLRVYSWLRSPTGRDATPKPLSVRVRIASQLLMPRWCQWTAQHFRTVTVTVRSCDGALMLT